MSHRYCALIPAAWATAACDIPAQIRLGASLSREGFSRRRAEIPNLDVLRDESVMAHDVVSCSARRRFASTSRASSLAIEAFADSVVEHAGGERAGRHVADGGERAQAEPRRRLDSNVYLISHGIRMIPQVLRD